MFKTWKTRAAWALSLLAMGCGPLEEQQQPEAPEAPAVVAETPGQAKLPLVTTAQKETITYTIKVIVYPNNFTQPAPMSDTDLQNNVIPDIRQQVNSHVQHIKDASNGLLQPVFDGTVTINRRSLAQSDFAYDATNGYQLTSTMASTIVSQDFGGKVPAYAFLVWGDTNTYKSANWTYPGSNLVSMISRGSSDWGILSHEFMHVMDNLLGAAGEPNMVGADDLKPSDFPQYTTCITTPPTRPNASDPNELDWKGNELIQNILSYDLNCNSRKLNYCVLRGRFGTFTSDLCTQGVMLNPVVSHPWVRQSYMYSADWLYTEWDSVTDASNYKLVVDLKTSSGTWVAQVTSVEPGAVSGSARYRYFHRGDLCNAVKAAGGAGGTYNMTFKVEPSGDSTRAHRANVSGTLTCSYKVEDGTYSWLTGHGGGSGTTSQLSCPSGYVAVGVVSRAGIYVDAVGLLCSYLYSDGSLGTAYAYGPTGGSGGTYYSDQCPAGQMLVGLDGRSYSWTDQISGFCSPVRTWVSSSPAVYTYLAQRGGTGGNYYWESCPNGYAVTSLWLYTGSYVNYIQARCNRVTVQ